MRRREELFVFLTSLLFAAVVGVSLGLQFVGATS